MNDQHPSGGYALGLWKLLSYFALEAQEQQRWIGYAQDWFAEDPEKTPETSSRNYLIGITIAFIELTYGNEWEANADLFQGMLDAIGREKQDLHGPFFDVEKLPDHPGWQTLRELARAILADSGAQIAHFRKPLDLQQFIEVENYVLIPRRKLKKHHVRQKHGFREKRR